MNTKIAENFGEHVKKLRMEKEMFQEEFAEKLSIHRTYMNFIEHGQISPSLILIFKISRVLGVKLPELFAFDK